MSCSGGESEIPRFSVIRKRFEKLSSDSNGSSKNEEIGRIPGRRKFCNGVTKKPHPPPPPAGSSPPIGKVAGRGLGKNGKKSPPVSIEGKNRVTVFPSGESSCFEPKHCDPVSPVNRSVKSILGGDAKAFSSDSETSSDYRSSCSSGELIIRRINTNSTLGRPETLLPDMKTTEYGVDILREDSATRNFSLTNASDMFSVSQSNGTEFVEDPSSRCDTLTPEENNDVDKLLSNVMTEEIMEKSIEAGPTSLDNTNKDLFPIESSSVGSLNQMLQNGKLLRGNNKEFQIPNIPDDVILSSVTTSGSSRQISKCARATMIIADFKSSEDSIRNSNIESESFVAKRSPEISLKYKQIKSTITLEAITVLGGSSLSIDSMQFNSLAANDNDDDQPDQQTGQESIKESCVTVPFRSSNPSALVYRPNSRDSRLPAGLHCKEFLPDLSDATLEGCRPVNEEIDWGAGGIQRYSNICSVVEKSFQFLNDLDPVL